MTRATEVRARVLDLDAAGNDPDEIAFHLCIPLTRVERILDDHDAEQGVPHPDHDRAPVLEPLGGPAVITSQAAVGGGRDSVKDPMRPKRQPVGKPAKVETASDIECGTTSGYYKHRRDKTPTCQPCRDAYNEYNAKRYPRRRPAIECGTYRGWKKHHRAKEQPCDDCRAAYKAKCQEWRSKPPSHGTPDGYSAHRRAKQEPCEACAPFGLTRKQKSQQRQALWEQGMTDRQIAEEVGVQRSVIEKWRQAHGLPVNREAS
jgi:hypothetical protein